MPVTTCQTIHSKPISSLTAIPKIVYENWDIDQYYRITDQHIVVSANHKKTNAHRVLILIPNNYFSKQLWKNLICLPDNKLLLPQKIHGIPNMHILEFPYCTPLKKVVQNEGLSLSQIISLILDLCNSLHCLHNAGILHMDISADNVYRTKEQHFILGDFSESCYQAESTVPVKKQIIHYPAPECQNQPPSLLSEQYQLGTLFFQLCNDGNAPPDNFCGIVPQDLPACQFTPESSKALFTMISKMLAQNPVERYSDLRSLQQDLESLFPTSLEQSTYRLFLPDETHAFHQTLTLRNEDTASNFPCTHFLPLHLPTFHLPPISFSPLIIILPFITICLALALLFCKGFFTANKEAKDITDFAVSQITTSSAISSTTEMPINTFTTLDIAGKNITSITSACSANQSATNIDILLAENNCITSLNDISLFPNLREIYLSNNQITDLYDLAALSNLEIIVLSDNHCANLSGLEYLHKLHFLDLSGNLELVEISDLYTLTSLETLILSDTSVSKDSVEQLKQILPKCNIIF
ncbi:MAG: protein kinase [Lachnospiraceae bacterium]|nr:protein kinase [Lachnospiraceae bacterium]